MQFDLFSTPENQRNIPIEDLFAAYHTCRKNKRFTSSALNFEFDYETLLVELWQDISTSKYQPSPASAFLVKKPVLREIFASHFRDRIVHHLIIQKLEPFFEKIAIFDSYACRKGKGTLFGIRRIEKFIRSCSQNYTQDAYILKLDIKAFFMNIDRTLLWNRLEIFIRKHYQGLDKEALINLCQKILLWDATSFSTIKGKSSDWQLLPKDKSLFGGKEGFGLPIGNLTSQIFANFFMNPFDHFIKHDLSHKYYGRYVDDFILVDSSKERLKDSIPLIRSFLKNELNLQLHPRKIYLQHFSKGVNFLGANIRPYSTIPGKRVISAALTKIHGINKIKDPFKKESKKLILSSLNSYFGILSLHKSYRLRKKLYGQLSHHCRKKLSVTKTFEKVFFR